MGTRDDGLRLFQFLFTCRNIYPVLTSPRRDPDARLTKPSELQIQGVPLSPPASYTHLILREQRLQLHPSQMLLIKQLCWANIPRVTVPSPDRLHQPPWGSRCDMSGSYIATSCRHREAKLLGTALQAGQEQTSPLLARPPKVPALKKCCPAASCLCSKATGSEERLLVLSFGCCATCEKQHPET